MHLRRLMRRTSLGRLLVRHLRRPSEIPLAYPPNAAFLILYPGERLLPESVRDEHIVTNTVEWVRQIATHPDAKVSPARSLLSVTEAEPSRPLNVLFVSYCDFTGSSALHIYSIACELHRRGYSPAIAVPENAEAVDDIGRPPFPVLTYDDARKGKLRFHDRRGVDLVHAFTPRELVRKFTIEIVRQHGCPYIVHLEDNEEAIVSTELGGATFEELRRLPLPVLDRIIGPGQSHPRRAPRFIEQAIGMTVVVDRLLEFKPAHIPGVSFWPGFDEKMLDSPRASGEIRAELRLASEDIAVVYTGSVHKTNRAEVESLYAAVAQLRRDEYPIVLLKTGWNWEDITEFPDLGNGIRDLGWVSRRRVAELLIAGDILVQPGEPGPYTDYRFPSKLPEYLASGKPVVLPRANIGSHLRDGEEALLLANGDAGEIAEKIARLASDPQLRASIGLGGQSFALRELRWAKSVDAIGPLYRQEATAVRARFDGTAVAHDDPVIKVVAFVPRLPNSSEARRARDHGIYGFCVPAAALSDVSAAAEPDYPFCTQGASDDSSIRALPATRTSPHAMRLADPPLVFTTSVTRDAEDRDDVGLIYEHLFAPLRRNAFRSIGFPSRPEDRETYKVALRKLTLQTLLRAPVDEPFLFIDAADAWEDPARRKAWLTATRSSLRDGIRQLYACQRFGVTTGEADELLRLV
jgi:glycosyltransferase involved in cell wall biosynthesis